MKKSILFLALAALFFSCQDIRTEYSDTLHERAVIVTSIYSPSEHRVEIKQTAYDTDDYGNYSSNNNNRRKNRRNRDNDDYIKTGVDYDGNQGIKISRNHQITETHVPEKFGVVFQCQHGTFSIEGTDQKHKILYNKLMRNVNDTVDVIYREEYRVTYEDKDGKKIETSRILNKLDFIDAQVIKH